MKLTRLLVAVVVLGSTGSLAGVSDAAAQPGGDGDVRRCESAAHQIPEFGGAYVEERQEDGAAVLHIWMTTTDAAATEAILAALRGTCPAYTDVVVREARYSYAELREWQGLAKTVPTVTLTGIDTRRNRLTVGVTDLEAGGSEVKDALAERGVPADAVALMAIAEARTLPIVDRQRPVRYAAAVGVAAVVVALATFLGLRRRRIVRRESVSRPLS